MSKIDDYENEVLTAFDAGQLKSVASKAELAKYKATALKDQDLPSRCL